jgi:hypothetical protein
VVKALHDSRYSWSAGSSGGLRTHGQCGDDELVLIGSSGQDNRYDGLHGRHSPIRVLIENDNIAGLALTNPFRTKNIAKAAVITYVGASILHVEGFSNSFLSTTGLAYGLALRSMPYGSVIVNINVSYPDYHWLKHNSSHFFTLDKEILMFNAQNWDIPQKVIVMIHDDEIARPETSYAIKVIFFCSKSCVI